MRINKHPARPHRCGAGNTFQILLIMKVIAISLVNLNAIVASHAWIITIPIPLFPASTIPSYRFSLYDPISDPCRLSYCCILH